MKDFYTFLTRNPLMEIDKLWRCERKDYSRGARIHTDAASGDMLKNLGDHNHDSNTAKTEVVNICPKIMYKKSTKCLNFS